jgi:hypothetical protein
LLEATVDRSPIERFEPQPFGQGVDLCLPISNGLQIAGPHVLLKLPEQFVDLNWQAVLLRHECQGTAAIFRGRLATAANAARIDACIVQRQTLLDSHFVLPGVAEVVFVPESFVDTKAKVGEADLLCIGREADAADLADAVIPAMDVEPMEMRIRPAKRNLKRVVKIGDRAIALHQQPGARSSG